MEIQGKLLEIFDTVAVSERFKKREFILEYAENPQFPEFLKFEVIQEKCELLEQFEMGQAVEVSFNLKGRKWTSPQGEVRYFNSLQAWKMMPSTPARPEVPAPPAKAKSTAESPPPSASEGEAVNIEEDDLPF